MRAGDRQALLELDDPAALFPWMPPGARASVRLGDGGILEEYEEIILRPLAGFDRCDLDLRPMGAIAGKRRRDLLAHGAARHLRRLDGRAELQQELARSHAAKIQTGFAWRLAENERGVPQEAQDLEFGVDDHPVRDVARGQDPVQLSLKIEGGGGRQAWVFAGPLSVFERGLRLQEAARLGEIKARLHGGRPHGEDLLLLIQRREPAGEIADGLRAPQHEQAARLQGVLEYLQGFFLERLAEVDHQVAAADQVQAREGRVLHQVVDSEDAALAQERGDAIAILRLDEETPQALGGDPRRRLLGIASRAGLLDDSGVHVRGEYLKGGRGGPLAEELDKVHGVGIGLFARGAARDPYADRAADGPVLEDAGIDHALQRAKGFRLAEERGHADQDVVEDLIDLRGVRLQQAQILLRLPDLLQRHAPLDAPAQRAPLIEPELDALGGAQELEDPVERVFGLGLALSAVASDPAATEPAPDLSGRKDEVDAARDDGRMRHADMGRRVPILGEGRPSALLDGLQTRRPVRSGS